MASGSTTPVSARSARFRDPPSAPPLTETPGYPFQLTIADVATLTVRDRIRARQCLPPLAIHSGREAPLRAAVERARRGGLRSREPEGDPPPRSAREAGRHGSRLGFRSAASRSCAHGRRQTLCLAGRASDYAALVRAQDLTLIATIPVGDAPGWAEVADDGRICLVPTPAATTSRSSRSPVAPKIVRLPIGNGPKHITVARIPASVIAASGAPGAAALSPARGSRGDAMPGRLKRAVKHLRELLNYL